MSKETADYHDADLVLRLYEMRREPVMRESRAAIVGKFWPKSYEDIQAFARAEHPMNAAYRQVSSYWEMVYGIVRHGIVNADFFLESNGEGMFFFARLHPFLEQIRRDTSPTAFGNAEWVATETEKGRKMFAAFEARVKKLIATR
jgi:hypothetical protein